MKLDAESYEEMTVVTVLLLVLLYVVSFSQPVVAPNPPPMHVEWNTYPVGLMMLSAADSAGVARSVLLPPGSLLQVPHWVVGADPDTSRVRS